MNAVRAVLVGGDGGLGDAVAHALGAPVARLAAGALAGDEPLDPGMASELGVVWIHLVPSCDPASDARFAEAELLLRSADAARSLGAAAGVHTTFVPVLPSPGLFEDARGVACDLALTATESLARADRSAWSTGPRRLAGVVYAGLEGHQPPGQRPLEMIRRRTPIGSLGTIAALCDAIRFVGSSRASYLTGTLLRVDGGWQAYSWIYPARTI